ncbi:MAG: hypothetical protein U0074_05630 [Kouleothrix sp.]
MIVIVTHDPEIGRQMDRVIGLRDGRLKPEHFAGILQCRARA